MKFLSDILAKAGLTVDGVVTLNNTATGQTPDANDNSTKLATTAWVRTFVQPYSLPIASASVLGGIRVGSGLSINSGTGVLSVTGASAASIKSTQTFVVTEGQTVFTVTGGYTPGLMDIFVNGVYLSPNQTTAINGTTFTINDPAATGDIVDIIVSSPIFEGSASTTDQLPEGVVNLYYTNARARAAISLTVTGTSGASTYNSTTGVLNVPTYTLAGLGGVVSTRTITINGVIYDLTANRSWSALPIGGTAGQLLAKIDGTDYNAQWINEAPAASYTSQLKHVVKAGAAINKGQAVYVSSSDGTNMIVNKASNASEQTSSKTLGLLESTVSNNGFTNVITEGLLAGLDTTGANAAGDPVWLGTDGNLIYGLLNKPSAPAHLVFIGVVTRRNANNGEIFVKVQNGFEMGELHDYAQNGVQDNFVISYELSTNLYKPKSIATLLGYTPANAARTLTINGTSYDLTADRTWTLTTSNIAEGTNLYYTDTRVGTYLTANSYATQSYVSTQINNLVSGAPGLLDTLDELAAALGDDPNFATTVSTALGNRLRVDINNQGLTSTQQGNGRTNLGLGSLAVLSSVGNAQITDLAYSKLTGVPSTFAPSAHTHPISDITGLQTALDGKQASLSGTGFVKISGSTISYDNSTYYLASNPSGYISGNQNITLSGEVTGSGATSIVTTIANNAITSAKINNGAVTAAKLATFGAGEGITWAANTDGASIKFESTGDGGSGGRALSNLVIALIDNADEGLKVTSDNIELFFVNTNQIQYKGANLATQTYVTSQGYLTGITSLQVTTALGYTPYNSTNPSGYITSSALSSYLPLAGGTMTGVINMAGTQIILSSGFAGIEYHNTSGQWESFVGTESGTGHLRYNSRLGNHTWYSNSSQTMKLNSSGTLDIYRIRAGGSTHDYEPTEGIIRMQNNQSNHNYIVSNGTDWGSWNQWIRYIAGYNTWRIGTFDAAQESGESVWRLAGRNRSSNAELNYIVVGPRGAWGSSDRVILWNPYARYDGGSYNGDGTHYKILDAFNYNDYAPTKTGVGASGSWGINITGTAASETLGTVTGRGATTSTAIQVNAKIGASDNNGLHLRGHSDITHRLYYSTTRVGIILEINNTFNIDFYNNGSPSTPYTFSTGGNFANSGNITAGGTIQSGNNVGIRIAPSTAGDTYLKTGDAGIAYQNTYFGTGQVRIGGGSDHTTNVVLSVAPGVINFDRPGIAGGAFQINSNGYGIFGQRLGIRVTPDQPLTVNQATAASYNQGIPATSGSTQNGILRLTPSYGNFGETLDFGMNVGPTYAWIQATNYSGLGTNYTLALNPNGGQVFIGTTSALQGSERLAVTSSTNSAILARFTGGSDQGWAAKLWNNGTTGDNLILEFLTESSITARGSVRYDRTGDRLNIVGQGNGILFTGIGSFTGSTVSVDSIRLYNTDGNYSYIRTTPASNTNNTWFDTPLGATLWLGWDNPGGARTASTYSQVYVGTGRGTTNESIRLYRGDIEGRDGSGNIKYRIVATGAVGSHTYFTYGNVGINDTNPTSLLTITGSNGGGDPYAHLRINGTGAYPNNIAGIALNNSGVQQHIRFLKNGVEKFQMRYNNGATEDNIFKFYSFITNNDFVAFDANNDNVGIGITTPLSIVNNRGLQIARGGHTMLMLGTGNTHGGVLQASDDNLRMFMGANFYDDISNSWSQFVDNRGYAAFDAVAEPDAGLARILVGKPNQSGYSGDNIFFEAWNSNSTSYVKLRTATDNALYIANSGKIAMGGNNPSLRLSVLETGTVISGGNVTFASQAQGLEIFNNTSGTTDNLVGCWFSTGPHKAGIASGRTNAASNWAVDLRFFVHGPEIAALDNTYEKMRLGGDGTLVVTGDVVAYGSPSDIRLKDIKEKVPNALESIKKLNGYRFDWKQTDHLKNIKEDIGVVAQEVADVLPELAKTNEDGFMSVRYQGLTAVLIEAVKEQQTQIESQKSEIEELKDLVKQLINR